MHDASADTEQRLSTNTRRKSSAPCEDRQALHQIPESHAMTRDVTLVYFS